MSAADPTRSLPPEADVAHDVGATEESLALMCGQFARLGDTFRIYSPARRSYTWVINHPDDVKRVLVGNHVNYTKGIGLDRVRILLGNGIMTSEGAFWRRQRLMMQPSFHRRVITEFARIIATENDALLERWIAAAEAGELVNVTDDTSTMTLAIVLRSIFGVDLDRLAAGPAGNPFDVVAREPARDLRFAYRFRSLTRLVGELIARRRAGREEHFDYISMLMNARDRETGDAMTDRELIDEILTLVVAGHETTASGLNWTWYLLARHPDAEARLHAELDAAPEYPAPTLVEAESLEWTGHVVDEALRLYPPGWLLSRRTVAPDVLGGYTVPAGTDVLLSPYLLHRHPRYWHDPESFRPERFDAAHEAERPRFAYMPFAAGPRHCIGETFALYEMRVHVRKIARRLAMRLEAGPPPELEAQVNLRTKHALYMTPELR